MWVDRADFPGIMVAQEMVERSQPVIHVPVADGEHDGKAFAGMRVIEFEAARLRQGGQGWSGQRCDRPGNDQPGRVAEEDPPRVLVGFQHDRLVRLLKA